MFKKFLMSFLVSIMAFSIVLAFIYNHIPVSSETKIPEEEVQDNNEIVEKNIYKKPIKDDLMFLVVGVDSKSADTTAMIRTDTMMLWQVNFVDKNVNILSIPRDSRVKIKGGMDKINHAHAYGGMDLTMETVRDFLDLDINYYVKMDYNALIEAVDAIGGVEVDVPRRMYYERPDENFVIDLEPGLQVLNGYQSLGLVRWRQSIDHSTGYFDGDLGRIATQQMFIKSFIKEAMKPRNIIRLPSIIKALYNNVETNVPLSYILSGLTFSTDIDNLEVNLETVPGTDGRVDGISYFFPDEDKTQDLLKDIGFKEWTGEELLEKVGEKDKKNHNKKMQHIDLRQ